MRTTLRARYFSESGVAFCTTSCACVCFMLVLYFVCQLQICRRAQDCVPESSDVATTTTSSGPISYLVVKQCSCSPVRTQLNTDLLAQTAKVPRCQRSSSKQTFFAGTPLETTIDVGVCAGRCKRGQVRNTGNNAETGELLDCVVQDVSFVIQVPFENAGKW